VDNKCLQQANYFKYLSCEICYENEKDIQQEVGKFAQILGIRNNIFKNTSGPEIFKNKSMQCTGCPHSFIWKRNLDP
jgi:hypothetical protein